MTRVSERQPRPWHLRRLPRRRSPLLPGRQRASRSLLTRDLFPAEETLHTHQMPGKQLAHGSRVTLRVSLAVGEILGFKFEKPPLPGSPLRNRTLDLLLTMNPRQVPSPQVNRSDLAEHEHTRALTSSRWALASTVLTLNLPLSLILFRRANGHRGYPSKMRATEGAAQLLQRDGVKLGILFQVIFMP